MARPSFRRRRLAGESGGGRDGYLCAWHRPRQERLQRGWAGCVRRGCNASQGKAGDADCSGGEASSVRCRDGGLLRGSSSRPRVRRPRPRCPADVARICPAALQPARDVKLFIDLVLEAAAKSPRTVVLSVRSDFYPDLQNHDGLRAAVQENQVSLGTMNEVELRAVIEGPPKAL